MSGKYKLDYYFYEACPFCARVQQVINELNIAVTPHDIHHDPGAMEKLIVDTGRRTVPCLYINDKPMHESSDIINWLKDNQDQLDKVD